MKKMNLFTLTCMCIGTIIGVGIFGSMPSAANYVGPSLLFVCIVAVIEVLIRYLPSLIPSSSIPASNGFYMYLTKLVNPYVGFLQVIQILFNVFVLSLLATVFGQYFNLLAPANETVVAIAVIIIFGFIAYFGLSVGALVQNVMVIVLISALGCYIIFGFTSINPELFTIEKAVSFEGVDFLDFGAALGLMASCLLGGYVGVNYAEQIKNPGKNIIKAFFLSTCIVGFIYVLMSVATTGALPSEEVSSLADCAAAFMPSAFYWFFICGGALFALATTINGSVLGGIVNLKVIARDRVLPDIFLHENKFGVSTASLILFCGAGVVIVAFGLDVGTLMSVSSVLGIIIAITQFIPALRVRKRYPNCYKNAPIKLPMPLIYVLIAVALAFCAYEGYSLVVSSNSGVWIALVATIILCYGYFFARIAYLKRRGIDLIAIMSEPYAPWEAMEKKYARLAENRSDI